ESARGRALHEVARAHEPLPGARGAHSHRRPRLARGLPRPGRGLRRGALRPLARPGDRPAWARRRDRAVAGARGGRARVGGPRAGRFASRVPGRRRHEARRTRRELRLGLVRRRPASHPGDRSRAGRVRARRASRRPDRREGVPAPPRRLPAGPSRPRAPPASGRDGVEPPRGRRILLRGAPATHARVASRGPTVRGELPHVPARAPGALAPRRARLYPARRLRAQLGPAPARSPERRGLGPARRALPGPVAPLRPGPPRLLLPLSDPRARRQTLKQPRAPRAAARITAPAATPTTASTRSDSGRARALIQPCSTGMPWTRMPPPTKNIAAVPATDRPFIRNGAAPRMPAPMPR